MSPFCMNCVPLDRAIKVTYIINIIYNYNVFIVISNLPQRTLSEILAPCAVMRDKKFELRVDEWKFVGHPFSLQTSSWSVSFNIAFVLQVHLLTK